jgi:hypothetical protein
VAAPAAPSGSTGALDSPPGEAVGSERDAAPDAAE